MGSAVIFRAGGTNRVRRLILESFEVFVEGLREFLSGFAISGLVCPTVFRKKNFGRDVRTRLRNAQAENVVGLIFDVVQRTVVNGVDDGARYLDGEAFANAVSSAAPTRIDEPDFRAVLIHVGFEKFSVFGRVPNEERRAEACGEGRLGFFYANFRTRDFGGVTGNEVVHRLFGGQLADRRKNAERVAGEKNDVFRMTALAAFLDVLDVMNRVGSAGVFGERIVVEVDHSRFGIENGVFKDGSEFDRVEDFRFAFSGKVNAFCVTTAFNIDNALVGPVVFVVADKLTTRFGGERSFSSSGKAKEQAGVAVFTFVRRAVHRQEAFFRHQVVHDRENTLLHFTGVFGAENDEFTTFKREIDARARGKRRRGRVGLELTGVEDDEIRFAEVGKFFSRRTDEHVVHEQRVISASANDANFNAVLGIPTGESVDDVKMIAGVQIIDCARTILQERGIGHLNVDVAPPNIVSALRIVDNTFVFRATAGFLSRGIH